MLIFVFCSNKGQYWKLIFDGSQMVEIGWLINVGYALMRCVLHFINQNSLAYL